MGRWDHSNDRKIKCNTCFKTGEPDYMILASQIEKHVLDNHFWRDKN